MPTKTEKPKTRVRRSPLQKQLDAVAVIVAALKPYDSVTRVRIMDTVMTLLPATVPPKEAS
jgi:hypothetical protein